MNSFVFASDQNLIPTRYSLLSRLQNWNDEDSWKVFYETYWRLIYSTALKAGLTNAEAQDVVQETIISVAKDIEKFKRDRSLGSFKGWLHNLIRWRIADQRRKRGAPRQADSSLQGEEFEPVEIADLPDASSGALEAIWEKEWQANLFTAALERVKRRVKEEHFQIFDLLVLREWPAGRVARLLNIHVGQVYLVKYRVGALIKKEIHGILREW